MARLRGAPARLSGPVEGGEVSRPTVVVSPRALAGERVELSGDSFRHLFRSRRLGAGAPLRLVDGSGAARWAEVVSVGRRSAVVAVGEKAPSNEASIAVELWVGVPRPRRAAWLVEKSTEVGVASIRWLDSRNSGREVPEAALERHRRIAVAAVEQSGRSVVPEISGLHSWSDLVSVLDARPTFALDRRGEARARIARPRRGAVRLVVGPEGGLSGEELAELERHDVSRLALGERVLRIETAAVAGAAVVLWAAASSSPDEV